MGKGPLQTKQAPGVLVSALSLSYFAMRKQLSGAKGFGLDYFYKRRLILKLTHSLHRGSPAYPPPRLPSLRLSEKLDPSAPPLLPRHPKSQTQPTTPDEADLAELVGKILSTSARVAAAVSESQSGKEGEEGGAGGKEQQESSFDVYMRSMKPLQFGKLTKTP